MLYRLKCADAAYTTQGNTMKLNKFFNSILAILAVFVFLSMAALSLACDKKGGKGNKGGGSNGNDVYAVTRHSTESGREYRYWKNGKSVQPFSTSGYSLGERCEAGGDVYTGEDDGNLIVKKNGALLHSLNKGNGEAYLVSICVSGGDIYVCGGDQANDGTGLAIVWKNGKVHQRLTNGKHNAGAETICLSGGDLYAGGHENGSQGVGLATVWKNGKSHQRLTDGSHNATVFSICVSGSDLYAGGFEYNPQGVAIATVWKNGKSHQRLSNGSDYASVRSLCVSGGDTYAGGYENSPQGKMVPTVWNNNKPLYRLSGDDGEVALVFVREAGSAPPPAAKADKSADEPPPGDVYAVTRHGEGYDWEYCYWKNGESVQEFSTDGRSLGYRWEAGNDTYDLWTVDGKLIIRKNNGTHHFLTIGDYEAEAYSPCVSGGDIYAVGGECREGTWTALVWKNDKVHQHLTDGTSGCAFSLCITNGDLYVGGNENGKAAIWKNGKLLQRLADIGNVNSLCVSGSDVYAGGVEGGYENNVLTVWKNGKLHQRLIKAHGYVSSLCVSGSDLYAGGYEYQHRSDPDNGTLGGPAVWKNGEMLYRLGDREGAVALVFVK
jgi:hypothetical protein